MNYKYNGHFEIQPGESNFRGAIINTLYIMYLGAKKIYQIALEI